MAETIARYFSQIDLRPGCETFFAGIVDRVSGQSINDELGCRLRDYAQGFLAGCDLEEFNRFSDEGYQRVHLGRDLTTGWEAIMMCWKKGNRTSVHGHPQFAAYNFAAGHFLVEVFRIGKDGQAQLAGRFEAGAGEGFFAVGDSDGFDNHIHRITCLSDIGHSLHIYSDDALKGIVYSTTI